MRTRHDRAHAAGAGSLAPARAPRDRVPAVAAPELAEFATDDLTLPRFHVWTLGCQMNHSDSEEMAGALAAAGCAEASDLDAADLIVINSCAIREAAEQKVIGRMGHLARLRAANPALRVVLTGCSVRADNGRRSETSLPAGRPVPAARRGARADRAAGPRRCHPARSDECHRGDPASSARRSVRRSDGRSAAPGARRGGRGGPRAADKATSAWLPIIYGCDKTCTYCIVPFEPRSGAQPAVRRRRGRGGRAGRRGLPRGHAAGPERQLLRPRPARRRSRFAHVRPKRHLGRRLELDGRPDMAALLRAVDGLRTAAGDPAISRVRFVTSHPWDLSERLIGAMADCPSVCEHLHLPVQSGDDAVLRRMGRQYTVDGLPRAGRAPTRGRARDQPDDRRDRRLLRRDGGTVRADAGPAAHGALRPGLRGRILGPAGHARRATCPTTFRAPRRSAACRRCSSLQEQIGLELNEAMGGADDRGARRSAAPVLEPRGQRSWRATPSRPQPAQQACPLRRASRRCSVSSSRSASSGSGRMHWWARIDG